MTREAKCIFLVVSSILAGWPAEEFLSNEKKKRVITDCGNHSMHREDREFDYFHNFSDQILINGVAVFVVCIIVF